MGTYIGSNPALRG